jgi:hypothetical protein
MASIEFVIAVGENEERRQAANAAAEIFEKVEGRGIRPVDILKHEHRRQGRCL